MSARLDMLPQPLGKVPVSWFEQATRLVSWTIVDHVVGSEPERLLLHTLIVVATVHVDQDDGSVPVIVFEYALSVLITDMVDHCVGSVPVKVFE